MLFTSAPARPLLLGLIFSATLAAAFPARAWGPEGHQKIGVLAEQLLQGSRALKEVKGLLRDQGGDLATAGLWADCAKNVIRRGDTYAYGKAGRFPECKRFETPAGMARMIGWVRVNWDHCLPVAQVKAAAKAAKVNPGDTGAAPAQAAQACHRRYHYTDLALQRSEYPRSATDKPPVGTRPDDVVGAIEASVATLQGRRGGGAVRLRDRTEALLLLVHLVGDLHQPLHVGSIYLDPQGGRIDPDLLGYDPYSDTVGGNRIQAGDDNLHQLWDQLPESLAALPPSVVEQGATWAVPATPAGPPAAMVRAWADDSLLASRQIYEGMRFGPGVGNPREWEAKLPANEPARREALQRAQLAKAAARLAQLLKVIWP